MSKLFIYNPHNFPQYVSGLKTYIPPGKSNIFELNSNLSYDQVINSNSFKKGLAKRHYYIIPDPKQEIIKPVKQSGQYIFPSRAKFKIKIIEEKSLLDFEDEEEKSARQLAIELGHIEDDEIPIPKEPVKIDNKIEIIVPEERKKTSTKKIFSTDITPYILKCKGFTAQGKRCNRQANKETGYCGLHDSER